MKKTIYEELSPELKKQVDAFCWLLTHGISPKEEEDVLKQHAANLIVTSMSILKSGDRETTKLYGTIKQGESK